MKHRFVITEAMVSEVEDLSDVEAVHRDDAPVINDLLDVIEKHQLSVSQAQRILSTTGRILPQITFLNCGHNTL